MKCEWNRYVSLPGGSFENKCERFSNFPLSCLVNGGGMCWDGALISPCPQWLWCWRAMDKKYQQEANLCCLNHGDGGIVCYWSITSAIRTSQYSLSSLGFFFTLVTFVNSDWHLDSLSTCLTFPSYSCLSPTTLVVISAAVGDPSFPQPVSILQVLKPQLFWPKLHMSPSWCWTHGNLASGNNPERGRCSLEFPHLISHTAPPFPSLISEVIYSPQDREREINLSCFKIHVCN